jgi:beta-lactam-binding protein with PASTA domain
VVANLDPGEGASVVQGAFVTVYTSNGQAKAVPNVVGESQANAVSDLHAAGFNNITPPACQEVPPGDPTENTVTAQNPAGGSMVNPSKPVTLTIAKSHC